MWDQGFWNKRETGQEFSISLGLMRNASYLPSEVICTFFAIIITANQQQMLTSTTF